MQKEVRKVKKLTAEEFAAKVMVTGTELEVDELRTQSIQKYEREWAGDDQDAPEDPDPDYRDPNAAVVFVIYAHMDDDGSVKVKNLSSSDHMLTTEMQLTQQQADALYCGDQDSQQIERQIIMDDLYPQYLEFLETV